MCTRLRVSTPSAASGEGAHLRFGVGLTGMRKRMQQLGGLLEIISGKDGTTVTAIVPPERLKDKPRNK